MKINKEFAPIIIILETLEERNQFLNILEAAYRKEIEQTSFWKGFYSTQQQSDVVQQINYIRKKLI